MHWLPLYADAVYASAPCGTSLLRSMWSALRYGVRSMYPPVLQNSIASSGTVSIITSGAVPARMAVRTSVSCFPGTIFTVIQGYFFSKSETTLPR